MKKPMNINERTIDILMKMLQGKRFDAEIVSEDYGVSERTFKRDLSVIRNNSIFADEYYIDYDATKKDYGINSRGKITAATVLAILKILIGSNALNKDELKTVEKQLLNLVNSKEQAKINKLLTTTTESYVPAVNKAILPLIGSFADWINERRKLSFIYTSSIETTDHSKVRSGVPVNMYFANRHFYVMMYLIEKDKTLVYRLDRFQKIDVGQVMNIPADKKPDEGRVLNETYMLGGGNYIHYKFRYFSSKAVALNNVPNSHLSKDDDPNNSKVAIVEGDLFSQGALFWVLSQGTQVKVIEPETLIRDLKETLQKTLNSYKQ